MDGDGEYPNLIAGRYSLGRLIGAGGMGAVFECTDTQASTPTKFAVKLIKLDQLMSSSGLAHFEAECRLLTRLDHPNIVRTYGWGVDEEWPYLLMELCRDRGLRPTSLRSHQERQEAHRLPPAELATVVPQALAALAEVHRQGLIHRDVKPDNFLLRQDVHGHILLKLTDFGLAIPGGEVASMMGTYDYMSPEQLTGEVLDARTDVYSVGVMIYRLATGFERLGYDMPTDVDAAIPAWVDDLVDAAVQDDRADRPADCGALLDLIPEAVRREAERSVLDMTEALASRQRRSGLPGADADAAVSPRPIERTDLAAIGQAPATARSKPDGGGAVYWLQALQAVAVFAAGVSVLCLLLLLGGEGVNRWLVAIAIDLPVRLGRTLVYYGAGLFSSPPLLNGMVGSHFAPADGAALVMVIPYFGVVTGLVAAGLLSLGDTGLRRWLVRLAALGIGLAAAVPATQDYVLVLAPIAGLLAILFALVRAMNRPKLGGLRLVAAFAAGALGALLIATLIRAPGFVRYGPADFRGQPQGTHRAAAAVDCPVAVEANWILGKWTSTRSGVYSLHAAYDGLKIPVYYVTPDGEWRGDVERVLARRLDAPLGEDVPHTEVLDGTRVYVFGSDREPESGIPLLTCSELPPGQYELLVDTVGARPFRLDLVTEDVRPRAREPWRPAWSYDLCYLTSRHEALTPGAIVALLALVTALIGLYGVVLVLTKPFKSRI